MLFKNPVIIVDASRCRSGGALQHFYQLFVSNRTNASLRIKYIIYVSHDLKKILPQDTPHCIRTLRYNALPYELFWQFVILPIIFRYEKSNLLFTLDSSSLCEVKRQVVLNQDILCFSLDSIPKKFSLSYFRQILIKHLSRRRLNKALTSIYLSEYARSLYLNCDKITSQCSKVIPHAFPKEFLTVTPPLCITRSKEINIAYVSPLVPYKNHDILVNAINLLHTIGFKVHLKCIGSYNKSNSLVLENIETNYIKFLGQLPLHEIIDIFNSTHIVVFASSCESFGITLLEKMASAIPLSTSRESGLLELVGVDYPYTFDPKDSSSIVKSLISIIQNYDYALSIGRLNREKAHRYNWSTISSMYHDLLYNEAIK